MSEVYFTLLNLVLNVALKCYVKKKKKLSQVILKEQHRITLQVYIDNLKRVIDVENKLGLVVPTDLITMFEPRGRGDGTHLVLQGAVSCHWHVYFHVIR